MIKHGWKIVVFLFALLQGIMYLNLKKLKQEVESLDRAMVNMNTVYNYRLEDMQKEVEDAFQKQASILEKTELTFANLDTENLTFTITYFITPKVLSDHTKVYLQLDSENRQMKREGIIFSHTETYNMFAKPAQPYVVIEDGQTSMLEQLNELQLKRLPDEMFPFMNINIDDAHVPTHGKYQRVGSIQFDIKPAAFFPDLVRYTSAELRVMHDDKIAASYPVDLTQRQVAISVLVDVKPKETATMMMVARDTLNFEHHYLLEHYAPDSSTWPEPSYGARSIYQNGKLVYEIKLY